MKSCVLVSAICVLLCSGAGAQWLQKAGPAVSPQPGFDTKEVVRQVQERCGQGEGTGVALPGDEGEFLIDTSVTWIGPGGGQLVPTVAFDGTNFLVVWQDYRDFGFYGGRHPGIYGARVTPQGKVLDPSGIGIFRVGLLDWGEFAPAVAFDGDNFLVVWNHIPDHSCIYGTRVTPQGVVLDPRGFLIANVPDYSVPAVDFGDSAFLVVWDDPNGNIYGARVTPDGAVVDTSHIVVAGGDSVEREPAVSFNGTNFLVVWQDSCNGSSDVYCARVSQAGVVLDTSGIAISAAAGQQQSPTVASNGSDFIVAWSDHRNAADYDIYTARMSADGLVLDTLGIPVSTAAHDQSTPALAFDGASYLVTWGDCRNGQYHVYGARVTPEGTVLDPSGVTVSAGARPQLSPAVGFGDGLSLVAWSDSNSVSACDIYGARMTREAELMDTSAIFVAKIPTIQETPAVASNGSGYLVVWRDSRGGVWRDIYGARVTSQGTVLDATGFRIAAAVRDGWGPAAAFDGSNYLVVWTDYHDASSYDILGARVSPEGRVLDTLGIAICSRESLQCDAVAAFDGTNYLVVWYDVRTGSGDIFGSRVTPGGVVLDPGGIPICTAGRMQEQPAVCFDGSNYLVAWMSWRGVAFDELDIWGARVTPGGVVLDPGGIPVCLEDGEQRDPSMAFDGSNYLVVWTDWRSEQYDIYGARMTPGGVVLDSSGIPIRTTAVGQWWPRVAFDGSDFVVVWDEGKDIYGARISQQGVVVDTFVVAAQDGAQVWPALVHGRGSQVLVVYQGWAGVVGEKTYDTYHAWGKLLGVYGVEERTSPFGFGEVPATTVVRGVLRLPVSPFTIHSSLFDMSGRRVMPLFPGPNDVRGLAPGVYFVRSEPSAASREPLAVRKVVLTR